MGRAERLAALRGKDVQQVLADALSDGLPAPETLVGECRPVSTLSDQEVLRLASQGLPPTQERRLSALLDKQQAGTLAEPRREELATLMRVYEASLLRQADALAEAVRRGLREPLAP